MRKLIAGLVLGTALATAPMAAQAETPKNALVMAFAIDDLITLDPAGMFEFTALEYAGNTYDRLIGFDNDDVSKIYGVVAESWDVSEDGLTFTFKIRDGIKFAATRRPDGSVPGLHSRPVRLYRRQRQGQDSRDRRKHAGHGSR
jgi:peptide/nickel transport system substrate-binding protein